MSPGGWVRVTDDPDSDSDAEAGKEGAAQALRGVLGAHFEAVLADHERAALALTAQLKEALRLREAELLASLSAAASPPRPPRAPGDCAAVRPAGPLPPLPVTDDPIAGGLALAIPVNSAERCVASSLLSPQRAAPRRVVGFVAAGTKPADPDQELDSVFNVPGEVSVVDEAKAPSLHTWTTASASRSSDMGNDDSQVGSDEEGMDRSPSYTALHFAKGDRAGEEDEVREVLEVLPCWKVLKTKISAMSAKDVARMSRGRTGQLPGQNSRGGDIDIDRVMQGEELAARVVAEFAHGRREGRCSWIIVNPNSTFRAAWDMLSLVFVMWDMVMIPFQLFDPPDIVLYVVMAWLTRLFWTSDIPMSFMTGVIRPNGFIEMRPREVCRCYLKSWFVLDLVIVSVDWLELMLGFSSGHSYARVGKSTRIIRAIRMLRLLRMFRIWQIVIEFTERIQSEKLSVMSHILKIVCVIIAWGHLTACIWYGIGSARDDSEDNWVDVFGLRDRSLDYRYGTCLDWALSWFQGGGTGQIDAVNSKERYFCIFMVLAGFIMNAAFTSTLTSSMTRLHILTSGQSQQLSTLRRYLAQNQVPSRLALRIQRNAQLGVMAKSIPEAGVALLSVISMPLKVELHYEMHSPSFVLHPFFMKYNETYPHVMRQICHLAAATLQTTCGDVIFSAGEIPLRPKMYIVRGGALEYIQISGGCSNVAEGTWVSEAVLWIRWKHQGMLRATSECQLLEIDATAFQAIVTRFDHPIFSPWMYAEGYVELLQSWQREGNPLLDVMDLPVAELVGNPNLRGRGMQMEVVPVEPEYQPWSRKSIGLGRIVLT